MAAIDTYAIAANALVEICNTTFAPEGVITAHDQLHEALGTDGPVCGVSPLREVPFSNNILVQDTFVQIQYFDVWEKEIDPTQEVDPRIITGLHARLKEALRTASITVSGAQWYFNWVATEYMRDPTGNNTRFVMQVRVVGNNSALVETTS